MSVLLDHELPKRLTALWHKHGLPARRLVVEIKALTAFAAGGIKVLTQTYRPVEYEQAFRGFIPGLSALDVLLTQGARAAEIVMAGGSLA